VARLIQAGQRFGRVGVRALNKRTLDVIDRLAALKCDPIAGMARIAMDKKTPLDIRARMFSELAQYVAPKRKALEHSGDAGMIEALLARIDDPPPIRDHCLGLPVQVDPLHPSAGR
jgi:hypothetical protein